MVDEYSGLEFSPDGRYLHQSCEIKGGFHSRLWDLDGPQPRTVLDDDHCRSAFRPDGREFVAGYPDRTIRFFDTASGRELRRFPIAVQPDLLLRWNPKLPQLHLHWGTSWVLLNVENRP